MCKSFHATLNWKCRPNGEQKRLDNLNVVPVVAEYSICHWVHIEQMTKLL